MSSDKPRRVIAPVQSEGVGHRPQVTAAVLNFNGRELLDVILPSLAAQTYDSLQVVVVDNGSTDESIDYVAKHWPRVDVVALPENVGVSAALNVCTRAGAGELVLLLNNDIELDERCVEELVTALEAQPQAAVVQAKLLDFTRRELLDGTGDEYSWAGIPHRRGQAELDRGQYDASLEVFGACAAAALYRREAFDAVGGFDERFGAICEDLDWSFRARLAGYQCCYAPSARAYHVGSASLGPRVSEFTLYHNWRNQAWIVVKDYPASALVRHAPDLLMGLAASAYVAVRHRCLRTWVRAYRDASCGLGQMVASRRKIQRGRVCGTADLERVIDGALVKLKWWLTGAGALTAPAAARRPSGSSHVSRSA